MKRISELDENTQKVIANALAKETKKDAKANQSWITNVEDMKALLVAMEGSHHTITLTLGKFDMKPVRHDGIDGWWLSPADDRFVPCGFFSPFKVKSLIAGKAFE